MNRLNTISHKVYKWDLVQERSLLGKSWDMSHSKGNNPKYILSILKKKNVKCSLTDTTSIYHLMDLQKDLENSFHT